MSQGLQTTDRRGCPARDILRIRSTSSGRSGATVLMAGILSSSQRTRLPTIGTLSNASPAHAHQNELRARQSERRSGLRGLGVGPVPPPPDRHAYAAPASTPTRAAGSRTAQRSPSTRTSGTSRRRTESASWFEKHSQVPILRPVHRPRDRAHRERDAPHPPQRQGQGRRAHRACLDLPSAACPKIKIKLN